MTRVLRALAFPFTYVYWHLIGWLHCRHDWKRAGPDGDGLVRDECRRCGVTRLGLTSKAVLLARAPRRR
jgi:hypothetical protein